MLHRLKRTDHLAELLPRFRIFDGVFDDPLHAAQHVGTRHQRADLHRARQRRTGCIADGEHVVGRDVHGVERDIVELARLIQAHGRADRHACGLRRNGKQDQVLPRTGSANDHVRHGGIGNEAFTPRDLEAAAGLRRLHLHVGRIPTGIGLQQRDGPLRLAGSQRQQIFGRGIGLGDKCGSPHRPQERAGQAGASHFLGNHGEIDQAQAQAASRFAQMNAQPSLLGDLGP